MAWIAAVVGAAASYFGSKKQAGAATAASEQFRNSLARAMRQLSPRHIAKIQQQLIPLLRSSVYAAGGGNVGESVKGALSKAGLLDSPIGAAISGAAQYAPDMAAFAQSLQLAMNLSTTRASLLAGANPPRQNTVSPVAEGLAGGARGYFAGSTLPSQQKTPSGPNFGSPPYLGGGPSIPSPGPPQQSYPNLYPTPGTSSPWDF
jgi:hypothetical protein